MAARAKARWLGEERGCAYKRLAQYLLASWRAVDDWPTEQAVGVLRISGISGRSLVCVHASWLASWLVDFEGLQMRGIFI